MTAQEQRPAAGSIGPQPVQHDRDESVDARQPGAETKGSVTAPLPAQAPAATTAAPSASRELDESPLRSTLSVLTTLGPPLTVATGLMIYFGWARSEEQASFMGVNVSLFGYSTQDYVIRSVSTLYLPLLFTGAVALSWLAVHRRLIQRLRQPSSQPQLRAAGRVIFCVGLVVALAAVSLATLDPERAPLLVPLTLAAGIAVAAYGSWLSDAADPGPSLPPWQRALRSLLTGGIITLALFWQLSNYAGVVGRGTALQIARTVPELPHASAFSTVPLGIQAPGVLEERIKGGLPADEDASRYRTTGLRLLTVSGGRIFLLHDGWTPQTGTVIILPDNDQVRWQFSR